MSYNARRPGKEPMGPIAHFFTTLFAVWIGAVLAGITLWFIGQAALALLLAKDIQPRQVDRR